MAETTNMRLVIDADTDGAVRGVKNVDRAMSGLDDTHVRAGASARKFGAAAAVGIAAAGVAAFAFGKSSVKAFADAQASMAVTESMLDKNNKGWRSHKGEIDRAIKSHMDLSGFDDEDLYRSFANISRVTGDTTKGLKAQTTIMDLARARGISLEQATNLVSKAYLGNTTSLKRLGIELPKGAKGMEVLDALNKKFAGSAKAYGDTTAGQAERMGVAWENLKEDVGQALIPAINAVLQGSLQLIAWGQAHWPQFKQVIGDAFRSAQVYAQQFMTWFRANVLPTIAAIVTGAKAFWAMFGDDVTRVFEFIGRQVQRAMIVIRSTIQIVLALIRGDWGAAWGALKTLVTTIFSGIVDTIRTLATTMLSVAAKVGSGIVTGIINGLKALGGKVAAEMGKAVSAVRNAAGAALAAAAAVGRAIVTGLFNGIKGLAALGSRILSFVVSGIGTALTTAYSMATGIGTAIVNGVLSGLGGLASAIRSKVQEAISFSLSDIDIPGGSPLDHTAAKWIGHPIVDGVAKGITEQARRGGIKVALTAAVKEALASAKEKAMSAASDLASSIGRVIDETTRRALGGLDNSPEAQRIRAIEAQQRASQRSSERAQLQGAIDQAQTPAERMAAQKAMDDWLLEQERQTLQDSLDQRRTAITDEAEARKTAADEGLKNLQAMLAGGLISQTTYNTEVKRLLAATAPDYRAVGESLGFAFASGFAAQLAAVLGWNPAAVASAASASEAKAVFAKAMGGPDKVPKALLPKHAAGIDYVPRTGPAIIHAGEAVLNPQKAAEYRAGRLGGGVSITFADGMGWLAQFVKVKVDSMSEAARRSSLAAGAVR